MPKKIERLKLQNLNENTRTSHQSPEKPSR